jgi:LacI family transcriptional regulator, galactose operon repressor
MARRTPGQRGKQRRAGAADNKVRRPTIRDVARLADVGVGTVSRVINNHPAVNPDIREVVTNAIAQLSYVPDALAGSMRRTHTHSVGCIFRSLSLPALEPVLRGAESVVSSAGSTLLLGTTEDRESELAQVRSFGQRRIDGVLMTINDERDSTVLDAISHYNMKTVFVNRDVQAAQGVVLIDMQAGMVEAARTLLGFGHRRIALLTLESKTFPGRAMLDGFREAHRGANLAVPQHLIRSGSAQAEVGFRESAALLAAADPPTAIIVGNHALLVGTLRAIRNAGLTIGQDISLITVGDSDLTEQMTPPISAIRWDPYEVGRIAAQMLIDSITSKDPAERLRTMIPTTLALRASCHRVK